MKSGAAVVAYIGLGSNIERPYEQIKRAIAALDELPQTRVINDSGVYRSKPMGPSDQPDYVNAVVMIETGSAPMQLLGHCQSIEHQQGRVRTRRWGERSIDLDILLYADEQLSSDALTLPHPGLCLRDFVYLPLLKLAPEIEIPGKGSLKSIIASAGKATEYACEFAGNIE